MSLFIVMGLEQQESFDAENGLSLLERQELSWLSPSDLDPLLYDIDNLDEEESV